MIFKFIPDLDNEEIHKVYIGKVVLHTICDKSINKIDKNNHNSDDNLDIYTRLKY